MALSVAYESTNEEHKTNISELFKHIDRLYLTKLAQSTQHTHTHKVHNFYYNHVTILLVCIQENAKSSLVHFVCQLLDHNFVGVTLSLIKVTYLKNLGTYLEKWFTNYAEF